MSSTVLVLLVGVPAVFMGVLLVGLLVAGGAASRRAAALSTPAAVTLTTEAEARIRELIARRAKIEAIKVAREHTGLGLKSAKDLVEAMEAGHAVPVDPAVAGVGGAPGPTGAVTPRTRARAEELIARGAVIQAIKVVREETGLGLKEAKNYCDALRAGRLPPVASLSERARALISAGDRAGAVAMVRAETGMSQSEAETFVDALE